MTNEELLAMLVACEARHAVETFELEGMHVWPLVRYEVMNNNLEIFARAATSVPAAGRLSQRAHDARRWATALVDDRSHNDLSPRKREVLFYSDGVSFVKLGQRWVERYCDPLADALEADGVSSLMLTPLHHYYRPRHRDSVFIQPLLDAVSTTSALTKRLRPIAPASELDAALTDLRSTKPSLRVPSVKDLTFIARSVRGFARTFKALLRLTQPRLVVMPCYYGAERMAMVLAARELGIPSVDIQHGVSGRGHWAFGQWWKVPVGGYDLLPDWFWCWRDEDAADIEAWAGKTHGAHRAIVGGNPIVEFFRAGDRVVRDLVERARSLTSASKKTVLVTLNGLETEAQCDALAQVVAECQSTTTFWLRLHPVRRGSQPLLLARLAARGAHAFEMNEVSELPLLALLQVADLHVTEGSSSVLEAIDCGVPSVLTSREHLSTYGTVDVELLSVVETPHALSSLVRSAPRLLERRLHANTRLVETVRSLLHSRV